MKNYVSNALRKAAPVLYGGGAVATLATAAPFAKKYASAFQDIPWRELTNYAQWPFAATGLGLGLLATGDVTETRKRGIRPHTLEYIGAVLQYAPVLAPLVSKITDENAIYSMVATGAAAVIGFCAKGIGAGIRNRKRAQLVDKVTKEGTIDDTDVAFEDFFPQWIDRKAKKQILIEYSPDAKLNELIVSGNIGEQGDL